MNRTTRSYKVLGITDTQSTCDCCGKTNLKRVVALVINDGAVVYYGTTCAAKALKGAGIKTTSAAVLTEAQAVTMAQAMLNEGHAPKSVSDKVWDKFGFLTDVKRGAVRIGKFAVVSAVVVEDEYNSEWLAYATS